VLDLLHRNFRLDVPHALDARQVLDLEAAVSFEVGSDDPEEEVAVSRHQVALDDLRQLSDRLYEGIDRLLVLTREPDAHEERQPHSYLRRIEQRRVAFDDADLLEQPDAPQAGLRREADALRELDVLHAPAPLERA
jgi:hypothetical protein